MRCAETLCTTERRQGSIERLPAEGWGAPVPANTSASIDTTRGWQQLVLPATTNPKFTDGGCPIWRHFIAAESLVGVAGELRRLCTRRTLPGHSGIADAAGARLRPGMDTEMDTPYRRTTFRDLRFQCRGPGTVRTNTRNIGWMEAGFVGHETFQKLHGLGLRNAQLALPKPLLDKSYLR